MKHVTRLVQIILLTGAILTSAASAFAGANPSIGWNYGTIVATPHYPIVGETAKIAVLVTNPGDAVATGVQVKVSFNDWGVTFMGWQEIDTVPAPPIPAGGSVTVEVNHAFVSRTHTCVEAIVVGATENTNPDDDRGQINLEVVNAGETFSWDVPVVNNGDQPLHLLVVGHCKGADSAGVPGQHGCREDVKDVILEAGAEAVIPIVIDLRGIPNGANLEFEVNAYDLDAANPFGDQNARNYVLFHIRKGTARMIIADAKLKVQAAAAGVTDKGLKKRIEEAAAKIANALNDKGWDGQNAVKKNGGAAVFAHMEAAAKHLENLLSSGLPMEVKAALDMAALKLVDAAKILVQSAGGDTRAGDAQRAAGIYPLAIHMHKLGWQ